MVGNIFPLPIHCIKLVSGDPTTLCSGLRCLEMIQNRTLSTQDVQETNLWSRKTQRKPTMTQREHAKLQKKVTRAQDWSRDPIDSMTVASSMFHPHTKVHCPKKSRLFFGCISIHPLWNYLKEPLLTVITAATCTFCNHDNFMNQNYTATGWILMQSQTLGWWCLCYRRKKW